MRAEYNEKMERIVLKWSEHVERVEEDRMVKRVFLADVEGGGVIWEEGGGREGGEKR